MAEVIITYRGKNEFSIIGKDIKQLGHALPKDIKKWFGSVEPEVGVKVKGRFTNNTFITERDFWDRQARSLSGIDFDCRTGLG